VTQQFVNALILGSIYALFGLGLTLSWGILNVLNLAHGAIFMSGGLVAWLVTKDHGYSIVLVLPLAMLVTGSAAVVLERLVFRPIRHRYADASTGELAMLIASVGAAAVPTTIALKLTEGQVKAVSDTMLSVHTWTIAGIQITNIGALIIVLAVLLSAGLALFVKRSKHGQALRALAFDPQTCALMGVSPDRLASLTMFVSGALAGAAGVLLAVQLGSFQSSLGEPFMLKAFVIIILGGVGSIGGAVFAAYFLAIVETAMVVYIDASLKDTVAFALIIVLLLVRPQGLFSRAAWERA
jgi:branched-chain amino acid transport system permease protein